MPDPQQRRRGRPRGTGVVDRDHILSITLDAVADGGYAAMSMRAVARTVGVSLATVQHHFGTKERLWQAAIDHYFAAVAERQAEAADQDLAGRIRNALDLSSARPGFIASLLGDRSPGAEDRLDYLAKRFSDVIREPTRHIEDLQAAGQVRAIDPLVLQLLIVFGIGSIAGAPKAVNRIYGFDLASPPERENLANALADIIGNGLRM